MSNAKLPDTDGPIRSAPDPPDLTFTKHELDREVQRITGFLQEEIPRTLWRLGVEMELETAVVGISGGVDSALVGPPRRRGPEPRERPRAAQSPTRPPTRRP